MAKPQLSQNEPNNPGAWEMLWKSGLWLLVGLLIAFLIFVILILVGWVFQQALQNRMTGAITTNPLLPLILIIIAFISTAVWNIIINWIYNLIFSERYYDLSKMFSMTMITNVLLFFIFLPLYIIFFKNIENLFVILAFHILFSIFISHSNIEFITNPNYCWVALIWTGMWFCFTILIFAIIYNAINLNSWWAEKILLSLPPILGYSLIPLINSIWEQIYYKFYAMWNDFLYIPSISEILVNDEQVDEVNVDL